MFKGVIFDMDGVLIDSEPLWQEAEKQAFAKVGLHLTTEDCMQTMGVRIDEVVRYWYDRHPWQDRTLKDVEDDILNALETLIHEKGQAMPGVDYILNFFEKRNFKVALASSSYMSIIETVLQKLHLEQTFEVVHSGEFEEFGKPHPAIYQTTLKKMNLEAGHAVAFEDSYSGLRSAQAAGLRTIAIPDKRVWEDEKYDIAHLKLRSLKEFTEPHLKQLQSQPVRSF